MIALSEKKKMTQVLLVLVMNLMELFVSELRVYTTSIIQRSKKRKITAEAHIRKPYLTGAGGAGVAAVVARCQSSQNIQHFISHGRIQSK